MKKALVHDWFSVYAGAERCVESFTNIWDDFDIFALVDFLEPKDREIILKGKSAKTSFIQNLPFTKSKFRNYLPLFPFAVEQFDLRDYDIILSSSHAVAKGVLTHQNQFHISYIHTPMRYAWDMYFSYLEENNAKRGLKSLLLRYFLHKIRIWDLMCANRVDSYIANSHYVAGRIDKIYGKKAHVIYPPVDTSKFEFKDQKEDFYITVSRLVPYKKIDIIVEAFNINGKKLVVIGDGPQMSKIKSIAKPNVEILGFLDDKKISQMLSRARAFIFCALEDFGIAPVEAQACGTPVICYGQGGAKESVLNGLSGVYFENQSVQSLNKAIDKFEKEFDKFDLSFIYRHAQKFSKERFEKEIKEFVQIEYEKFIDGKGWRK
ncbi:glycosyltransferase family 4 protein [Campylobacter sp. RM15925]|uniref:glycosyltransferase family 4 protein n=1 Tax=Campylobacter sp. RM15925 TaxID=1705724 RepID=UPI001474B8C3|nr:glycosyltransferase family 4 protein [Campylobacter sp. RM15925]